MVRGNARRARGIVGGTLTVRGHWFVVTIIVSHNLVRLASCGMKGMTAADRDVTQTILATMERFGEMILILSLQTFSVPGNLPAG